MTNVKVARNNLVYVGKSWIEFYYKLMVLCQRLIRKYLVEMCFVRKQNYNNVPVEK